MTQNLIEIYEKTDNGISRVGIVEIPIGGSATVIIDRKDDGSLFVTSAEVSPTNDFLDALRETQESLKNVHDTTVRSSIATQQAMSSMFALKRYLPE